MECRWCSKAQRIVECLGLCSDCYSTYYWNNVVNYYECPICHGKFTIPALDGCAGNCCPWCGKKMEGLK